MMASLCFQLGHAMEVLVGALTVLRPLATMEERGGRTRPATPGLTSWWTASRI